MISKDAKGHGSNGAGKSSVRSYYVKNAKHRMGDFYQIISPEGDLVRSFVDKKDAHDFVKNNPVPKLQSWHAQQPRNGLHVGVPKKPGNT